jgi:hypothetical protein
LVGQDNFGWCGDPEIRFHHCGGLERISGSSRASNFLILACAFVFEVRFGA